MIEELSSGDVREDRSGYRDEFLSLVNQARKLAGK
jgi:hypothetical protein